MRRPRGPGRTRMRFVCGEAWAIVRWPTVVCHLRACHHRVLGPDRRAVVGAPHELEGDLVGALRTRPASPTAARPPPPLQGRGADPLSGDAMVVKNGRTSHDVTDV